MRTPTSICKSLAEFLENAAGDEATALPALYKVQMGLQTLLPEGPTIPEGVIPKRVTWRGLRIDIENPRGTWRVGVGWRVYMLSDYGYIRKTDGADGEDVDVYLGPQLNAPNVYIVHQRKHPDFALYDEDKCMIGYPDAAAAKRAYEAQYDNPAFFGAMEEFAAVDFPAHVKKYKKAPGHVPDGYLSPAALMERLLQKVGVA